MICKTCFHEIDDNETSCPYCGAQLSAQGGNNQQRGSIRVEDDYNANQANRNDNYEYPAYDDNAPQETEDETYYEDEDEDEGEGGSYVSARKKTMIIIVCIIAGFVVFGCALFAFLHFSGATTDPTTTAPTTDEITTNSAPVIAPTSETTTESTTETTTAVPSTEFDKNGVSLPDGYYTSKKSFKVTASSLNVRKTPGTTGDKLFSVVKGGEVTAVGYSKTVSGWVYITYDKTKANGWVSAEFLDGAAELSTAPTEESTTAPSATTTAASSSTTASSSTSASNTTTLVAISSATTSATTASTTAASATATAAADNDKSTPDVKYETPKTYYVSTDKGLNMRKGPGTTYSVVGSITKDTPIKVVGKNNDDDGWYYVYNEATKTYAWVSSQFISENKQ